MTSIIKQDHNKINLIFKDAKAKILKALGFRVSIEHVGSTAVLDLDGKGIIDILVGVDSVTYLNLAERELIKAGFYAARKARTSNEYSFLASRAEETIEGDVHIHLVIIDSQCYNDFILLRDYLKKDHEELLKYAAVKHKIIEEAGYDRERYKELKSHYVSSLLRRIRSDDTDT